MNTKKRILISILAILLIAVVIGLIIFFVTRNSEKKIDLKNFKKITIYNYLENDLLTVQKLYLADSNSNLNDVELLQVQIQSVLDSYFTDNPDATSVSVQELYSLLEEQYKTDSSSIDFHGLVLSNYEYNFETDMIEKSPNSNIVSNDNIYSQFVGAENQTLEITNITELPSGEYKVYGNILDGESVISSAEIILKVENGNISIQDCSINNDI